MMSALHDALSLIGASFAYADGAPFPKSKRISISVDWGKPTSPQENVMNEALLSILGGDRQVQGQKFRGTENTG